MRGGHACVFGACMQRPQKDIWWVSLPLSVFFFEYPGLSLKWKVALLARLVGQGDLRIGQPPPTPPHSTSDARVAGRHSHSWLFHGGKGFKLSQALTYPPRRPPSPHSQLVSFFPGVFSFHCWREAWCFSF